MSKLTLYTDLGSDFNTTHSIVGSNATNTQPSPSYTTGYYTNSSALTVPDSLGTDEGVSWDSITVPINGSISVWFKPNGWGLSGTSLTGTKTIRSIFDRQDNVVPLFIWRVENGVGVRGLIHDSIGATGLIDCTTCTITDGQWHLASMSWNSDTNIWKMYLDGVEIGSQSHTINFDGIITSDFCLGSRYWSGDQELSGDLDTLKWYPEYKTNWDDRNQRRSGMLDINGVY